MPDPYLPGPAPKGLHTDQLQAVVNWALSSRHCVRAFLPDPLPRATIEEILAVASRAPSGTNIQPWKVHVLTGETRRNLADAIVAAYDDPRAGGEPPAEYAYYPRRWVPPYLERRRKIGWDLYGLLGIEKGDKKRMHAQYRHNFDFFGAPVGLIFTIDRILERGSWLDYGMFLQNIMIAARGHGLDTCPQAAFIHYHGIITEQLQLPDEEMVVCAMSMGYADPNAAENRLVTEREPVAGFCRFHD